jgi:hypothetical protein
MAGGAPREKNRAAALGWAAAELSQNWGAMLPLLLPSLLWGQTSSGKKALAISGAAAAAAAAGPDQMMVPSGMVASLMMTTTPSRIT